MTTPKDMTKTQRMHWQYAVDARRMIEYDLHSVATKLRCLPKEWDEIWEDKDRRDPKKISVTIRLDADVVKFFRTLGPGYQPRINRVLRAFMHMRRAKVVHGPDTTDYIVNPERLLYDLPQTRPAWGDDLAEEEALEEGYEERREKFMRRKNRQKMTDMRKSIEEKKRKMGLG